MSNNLYNFTYYIGAFLFGVFLYSLDSFAEMWLVGLSLLLCSLIVYVTSSKWEWENISFLGILISGTGLFLGLILKFLDYVNQSSQLM